MFNSQRNLELAVSEWRRTGQLAGTWLLAAADSRVAFATRAVRGLVPVRAVFAHSEGELRVTSAGDVTAEVVVASASVKTRRGVQGAYLRSERCLDAGRYPGIALKVDEVRTGSDHVSAAGVLSIKGHSKDIVIRIAVAGASLSEITFGARCVLENAMLRGDGGVGTPQSNDVLIQCRLTFRKP